MYAEDMDVVVQRVLWLSSDWSPKMRFCVLGAYQTLSRALQILGTSWANEIERQPQPSPSPPNEISLSLRLIHVNLLPTLSEPPGPEYKVYVDTRFGLYTATSCK